MLYTKNMLLLLTSICLFFSSFYLLFPVLPLYVNSLGGDQADVGFIVGVFTLSSVLVRPALGTYTDKFGRKPFLLSGNIIFFVSPFFYFSASTVCALFLVRVFHGLGLAAFTVSSVAMTADMSPPSRRGEAFGAFGLAAMVALTGSPAVGTWILDHYSFTAVFLTGAALAGLSILLSLLVKESHHHQNNPEGNHPIKKVVIPSVIILLCTVTYGSIVAFLPFFAYNIPSYGLFYTFYAFSSIAIRIPVGRISDRVGRQKIIFPGLLITAVSLVVLSSSNSLVLLITSGTLYGLGFSSVYPTLTALLVDRIPEEARARGLSYFTASFDMGIALGSVVFGFFPLLWIYPAGAVIILSGAFFFYLAERSSSSTFR